MSVSLVIPYIVENDLQREILDRCVAVALENKVREDTEIILIDNGSPVFVEEFAGVRTVRNHKNVGVLPSFPQGYEESVGDVIAFIHSDVLLHHYAWDERIDSAFAADEELGLAGLFGATGLMPTGDRSNCFSNMLGLEYGKCGCHDVAGYHHGNVSPDIVPVCMFDGVGLFFRKEALSQLMTQTDAFSPDRAPHHFYDRILSLKIADAGWHMAMLGIGFDHWSGATAGGSKIYEESAREWLASVGCKVEEGQIPDQAIYNIAEQQFFAEWQHRLPLEVDAEYNYRWSN